MSLEPSASYNRYIGPTRKCLSHRSAPLRCLTTRHLHAFPKWRTPMCRGPRRPSKKMHRTIARDEWGGSEVLACRIVMGHDRRLCRTMGPLPSMVYGVSNSSVAWHFKGRSDVHQSPKHWKPAVKELLQLRLIRREVRKQSVTRPLVVSTSTTISTLCTLQSSLDDA